MTKCLLASVQPFDAEVKAIVAQLQQLEPSRQTPIGSFSPHDFHLTGAGNGPCSPRQLNIEPITSPKINHSTLNNQTLPAGYSPHVSRESIISALAQTDNASQLLDNLVDDLNVSDDGVDDVPDESVCDESSTENQILIEDFNNNEHHDAATFVNEQHAVTEDLSNDTVLFVGQGDAEKVIHPMCDQLCCELELMKLMLDNQLHLNLFKPIMDWAIKCSSRSNFTFNNMHSRTRNKILSELRRCTGDFSVKFGLHVCPLAVSKKSQCHCCQKMFPLICVSAPLLSRSTCFCLMTIL